MTLVLKRRKFRPLSLTGVDDCVYNSGADTLYSTPTAVDIAEHQLTWSESHPWPKGKGVRDIGGPFETIRTSYRTNYDISSRFSFHSGGGFDYRYNGNVLACNPAWIPIGSNSSEDDLKGFVPSLGDSTLDSMGATAISRCAPTAPSVDTSVAVAELFREGLPSLVGLQLLRQRGDLARAAGSEYLNVQFGWLPLVSDIKSIAKAVDDSEKLLSQLVRDSGKNVRRSYRFPETDTTDTFTDNLAFPWPNLTVYHWSSPQPSMYLHVNVKRSVWFDGCFTYYVDPKIMTDLGSMADKARLLLGIQLTPDVLWNLAPWTWLLDWFVAIGPVISNLTLFANDGLTLRYGYTMENTVKTVTFSYPGLYTPLGEVPKSPKLVFKGERKIRRKGNPFSIGLVGTGLNLRQLSILTALGITRA